MTDPQNYFFKLPNTGRPEPHRLSERWYPGVSQTWEKSTSSRIYDTTFGVRAILIHATAGSSSSGAMSVMKGGNASWHWLVPDENETAHGHYAWACAPEARAAWHVRNAVSHPLLWAGRNRINHWSLGVELVNTQKTKDSFSQWQVEMTAHIVRYAWAKYPNLEYVVSHAMLDPHRRTDPGKNFDWLAFKDLVTSPPHSRALGLETMEALNDAPHISHLKSDSRISLCRDTSLEFSDHGSALESIKMSGGKTEPDWKAAVSLAGCALVIYKSDSAVKKWTQDNLHSHSLITLNSGSTQGFIAESDDKTIIAFRGSKGIRDWIVNMKLRQEKLPYGKIHRGFLSAFTDVQTEVFAAMTRARIVDRPIYLTGHSLGGALASIAAAQSHHEIGQTPIAGLYTFGMPKTCDKKAAKHINNLFADRFYRFVNNDDIVTKIPPRSRHVGQKIHFDENGDLINRHLALETLSIEAAEETGYDEYVFKILQEELAAKPGAQSIEGAAIPGAKDHNMEKYLEFTKRAATK